MAKSKTGSNAFIMSPPKWIETTNAIGEKVAIGQVKVLAENYMLTELKELGGADDE